MSGDHDEHDIWEYKQEKLEKEAIKVVSGMIHNPQCKEEEELLIYILKKICN